MQSPIINRFGLLSRLTSPLQCLKTPWTMAHGFYALMGGFVFDFDESFTADAPVFASGIRRLSLTPRGVKLLAQCGHLPEVSEGELADKSKVDELGKLLACVQAGWMLVQVCSRLALRLPVTLIEVTTVGHVLCALFLYALWWHKPRNVQEPTVLTGEWTSHLAAFMMMSSRVGQEQMLPDFRVEKDQSEIAGLKFFADSGAGNMGPTPHTTQHQRLEGVAQSYLIRTKTGLPNIHLAKPGEEDLLDDTEAQQNEHTEARWQLACSAIGQYPAMRHLLRHAHTPANHKYELALESYPEMPLRCRQVADLEKTSECRSAWLECSTQNLVTAVASNWPHDGLLRTADGLAVGTILWIASIAFSGVHIAAWHAVFPSTTETWLWRSSSLYIGFSGALWAALHLLAVISPWLWWTWYDIMSGEASPVLGRAVTVICSVCGCTYVFARGLLIVEAFASLRALPAAAYVVAQWTLSVPHLG